VSFDSVGRGAKIEDMAKRTIKPAAGESRVSVNEATSAARVVYRDGTTGRFVILNRDAVDFTITPHFSSYAMPKTTSKSQAVRRSSKKK